MGSSGGIARGDASEYDLAPGTMVGEYSIEGELGAGGMGKVYAATHPVIAKRAAVKVLHPQLSVNREAVERFIQEARSVNQIGHPNIVDIFAFGQLPDGRSYFVMEWLRGESLRERIDRRRPQIGEALRILDSIAVALGAAHEAGIVHRDLKPDNVFLVEIKGAPPQVKLLDFGIAKLLGQDDTRAERTRTGNLMGTPAYISPEQARGYAVDHRTDIYALGALAYEMLTGSLPFPADNAADMIAKHLFEPPPHANAKNPAVSSDLDQLLVQMLAKEADERPSLDELRTRMARVAAGLVSGDPTPIPHRMTLPAAAQPTPPPGSGTAPGATVPRDTLAEPRRSRPWLVAAVAIAVVGAGLGVFVATRDHGASAPASEKTKPATPEAPTTTPPAPETTKAPATNAATPTTPATTETAPPTTPATTEEDAPPTTPATTETAPPTTGPKPTGTRPTKPKTKKPKSTPNPNPKVPDDRDAPM